MFNLGREWKIDTDKNNNLIFSHINENTEKYEIVKIFKIPKSHKKKKSTLQKLKDLGNKITGK